VVAWQESLAICRAPLAPALDGTSHCQIASLEFVVVGLDFFALLSVVFLMHVWIWSL
jgi:hypothetical protein